MRAHAGGNSHSPQTKRAAPGNGAALLAYHEKKKMKENSLLLGGFFALREDDLIHKEEDDHGDAAVEHGGADVVDEVRYCGREPLPAGHGSRQPDHQPY